MIRIIFVADYFCLTLNVLELHHERIFSQTLTTGYSGERS